MARNFEVRVDVRKLEQLMNTTPQRVGQMIAKLARDTEADIKSSFSPQSPSAPGEPPGVDTGALKNSIVAEQEAPFTWVVHDGVEYGVMLEYGTTRIAARPFFLPAVERAIGRMPDLFKEVIK